MNYNCLTSTREDNQPIKLHLNTLYCMWLTETLFLEAIWFWLQQNRPRHSWVRGRQCLSTFGPRERLLPSNETWHLPHFCRIKSLFANRIEHRCKTLEICSATSICSVTWVVKPWRISKPSYIILKSVNKSRSSCGRSPMRGPLGWPKNFNFKISVSWKAFSRFISFFGTFVEISLPFYPINLKT